MDNTVVRCTAGVERGETSVGFGRREKEGPHDLDVAECSRGGRPRLNACGEGKWSKASSGGGGRDKSGIGRKGGSRRLQGDPRTDPFHVLKANATDAESEKELHLNDKANLPVAKAERGEFLCDVVLRGGSSEALGVLIRLYKFGVAQNGASDGAGDDSAVGKIVGDLLRDPGSGTIHGVEAKVFFVSLVGDKPTPRGEDGPADRFQGRRWEGREKTTTGRAEVRGRGAMCFCAREGCEEKFHFVEQQVSVGLCVAA